MSANAFTVQLDGKRVRVVLEPRRRGGVFHARFYWRGKPIWKSTQSAEWNAAKSKAEKIVAELAESRPAAQTLTVASAVTEYLNARWSTEQRKGNRTYQDHKFRLNKLKTF